MIVRGIDYKLKRNKNESILKRENFQRRNSVSDNPFPPVFFPSPIDRPKTEDNFNLSRSGDSRGGV